MNPRPDLIDKRLVRYWLGGVCAYVRKATAHLPDPGQLQLVTVQKRINPVTGIEQVGVGWHRFDIDDVDGMVEWSCVEASVGRNVYISARTVRRDLPEEKYASE